MKNARSLYLLMVLLMHAQCAWAWGALGHRVVGEYAQQRLNPAAQEAVAELLAGEADPTLAGVANWADEIRDGPAQRRNTAPWHWVNFPRGSCAYERAKLCPDGVCLPEIIKRFEAELVDPELGLAQRREALKFLVHFVGDAHQPLHAGYADDRGGNRFQLNYRGDGTNLHSVWDSLILNRSGLDVETLVDLSGARLRNPPAQGDAVRWVEESCKLVGHPDFYPPRRKIADSYLDAKRPWVERRLAMAGERLATLLNQLLGDEGPSAGQSARP